MRQWTRPSLVQTMTCCPLGAKPLSETIIVVNWTIRNKIQGNINQNSNIFFQENSIGLNVLNLILWIKCYKSLKER